MFRAAKVARRRARIEKKQGKRSRPRVLPQRQLSAKAGANAWPKRVSLSKRLAVALKKELVAAGFLGALALGNSGCGQLTYPMLRGLADSSAQKVAGQATGIVPGGSSVGRDLGSKAVDFVLGPNPAEALKKMKSESRLKYSADGSPVSTEFWFKPLGLNPKIEKDRRCIDLVERVARKTTLFPEEVVLVIGANASSNVADLRVKIETLRHFLNESFIQIGSLEVDVNRFHPKMGSRAAILKQLKEIYRARDRVAREFLALETLLKIRQLDPESFDGIMKVGRERLVPSGCRNGLNSLN